MLPSVRCLLIAPELSLSIKHWTEKLHHGPPKTFFSPITELHPRHHSHRSDQPLPRTMQHAWYVSCYGGCQETLNAVL